MIERTIAATIHGRYLVETPSGGAPVGTLVGCHGYAEPAEAQLERMRAIAGADRWLLVAVQGLHRFYHRRANEVVASWMTRQDRELAIADNAAYVAGVVDAVGREWPGSTPLGRRVDGAISVGGDVPPELDAAALGRIDRALICRGVNDEWYTTAKFDADIGRLRVAGAGVTPLAFDGGHEWSDAVNQAAGVFLHAVLAR